MGIEAEVTFSYWHGKTTEHRDENKTKQSKFPQLKSIQDI